MVQDDSGKKYFLDSGVIARDKEVFDTESNAWYWFDADGTMATDKDAFIPTNQERTEGKWVRYNESGGMIKGEDYRYGGWYYFESVTGTMMKGPVILEDGRKVFYDTATGQMVKGEYTVNGQTYIFDEIDGHLISGNESLFWIYADGKDYWYENWQRQGWEPSNIWYRGKEIYDPASNAWYWLDNVQQGAKAVSKDVYQESSGGKWVRYDAQGSMIKGWNEQNGSRYYFDLITGAMAKGNVVIDGVSCYFDENTGILQDNGSGDSGNGETHEHSFTWEANGNTRTQKCSCGETGITEEYVAGVWGVFDYSAAQELFYLINATRAETQYGVADADGNPIGIETVPALTNFDGYYEIAKQRAAEIATNYSHAGIKTVNENLGGGAVNAQECYEAWCYSRTHARTMTNEIYTQGSCAVFRYDADGSGENLYPFYVLVVDKDTNITTEKHTYEWEVNGNTRTAKCSECGKTGVTEEFVEGVWGYFDLTNARELAEWIDSERLATLYEVSKDESGVEVARIPPLNSFYQYYDIAKKRAAQLASNYSHDGQVTENEIINCGVTSGKACYLSWKFTQSTYDIMVDRNYTDGSCAVFYHDADDSGLNLKPYYVLVLE